MTESLPTNQDVTAALARLIEVARAEFGETQWRYSKRNVSWVKHRRQRGSHFTPIGKGTEVTKEEYDANVDQAKWCRGEAFMGRLPRSYVDYDKEVAVPGWREHLIEMLKKTEAP